MIGFRLFLWRCIAWIVDALSAPVFKLGEYHPTEWSTSAWLGPFRAGQTQTIDQITYIDGPVGLWYRHTMSIPDAFGMNIGRKEFEFNVF